MTVAMSSVDVLNGLLALHNRSLPMYLHYAKPWATPAEAPILEALEAMVVSHREFVDRFGPRLAHLNGVLQVLSQLSAPE